MVVVTVLVAVLLLLLLLLPLPLLFGFPSVSPSSFFCCSLQILIFLDFYSLALNLSSTAFIP